MLAKIVADETSERHVAQQLDKVERQVNFRGNEGLAFVHPRADLRPAGLPIAPFLSHVVSHVPCHARR